MDNIYCRYFIDEIQVLCEYDFHSLYLMGERIRTIRMTSNDTSHLEESGWKLVTDEGVIDLYKRLKLVVDYE